MTRCPVHGCYENPYTGCEMITVLTEVGMERKRQFELHGMNLENESGTGPDVTWAAPLAGFTGTGASRLERALRRGYEGVEREGRRVTWMEILREEIAEAFKESDPEKLREELIQVAAVAVSWAEKLHDPESAIGSLTRSGDPVAHS